MNGVYVFASGLRMSRERQGKYLRDVNNALIFISLIDSFIFCKQSVFLWVSDRILLFLFYCGFHTTSSKHNWKVPLSKAFWCVFNAFWPLMKVLIICHIHIYLHGIFLIHFAPQHSTALVDANTVPSLIQNPKGIVKKFLLCHTSNDILALNSNKTRKNGISLARMPLVSLFPLTYWLWVKASSLQITANSMKRSSGPYLT